MAWLRLDDGFTKHPKFEGWPPTARWAWLEAMEYCARYRTRGRIPDDLTLLPRNVTAQLLRRAEAAGWCSRGTDGALWINDWDDFNPPRTEDLDDAVAQAIHTHPEASANELARIIGGRRKPVLEAIRRFRIGSQPVPKVVPREPGEVVPEVVMRAPARATPAPANAPVPVPSKGHRDGAVARTAASAANGLTPAAAAGEQAGKKTWNRAAAEHLIRNIGWLDPHPADLLQDTYDQVPEADLEELAQLAKTLQDAELAEQAPT